MQKSPENNRFLNPFPSPTPCSLFGSLRKMRIAALFLRSKSPLPYSTLFPIRRLFSSIPLFNVKTAIVFSPTPQLPTSCSAYLPLLSWARNYHDGRPRGSLWRGKKLIGKEALFVTLGLKRFKNDEEKLEKFIKTHVFRLLKMDMIAVLNELERQEEVRLAVKIFQVIQKQDWYKPDVFQYKDLIVTLARRKKMDIVMELWESMRKEKLFPDSQTYTEVIRGFLHYGSPADAMNIYEDMKKSPDPPEQLPFRILLKGLLPHPLLRNRVKQDFEEFFPDQHVYDPPEEIFGLR